MADPSDESLAARRTWLVAAESRLTAGLETALGDRLRRGGRDQPTDRVVVSAYDLGVECPARWAHPARDEYVESASNAARRLGRMALRQWRIGRDMPVVVGEVLSETDDWAQGLRTWFEGLDRAGQAAVSAAATAWAVGALAAVQGRDDLHWVRQNELVDLPGRWVRLRGSWDAFTGTRARPVTLLVMSGTAPDEDRDAVAAGFAALVSGLGPKVVPERVRIGSAGAGSTRAVAISSELLVTVVDRVVDLVAQAAVPDDAPELPGRWCSWCHLLESCDSGTAFLADPAPPV